MFGPHQILNGGVNVRKTNVELKIWKIEKLVASPCMWGQKMSLLHLLLMSLSLWGSLPYLGMFLHSTIERLTKTCKLFWDAVYGGEMVVIFDNFLFIHKRNGRKHTMLHLSVFFKVTELRYITFHRLQLSMEFLVRHIPRSASISP